MHYRLMYPSEYLNAADLNGQEVPATIEKVVVEEVPGADGTKKPKPVMYFKSGKKRLPLPKTCARVIAAKYGNNTDDWTGKKVVLFPTTCMAFGQTVECVRVK